MRNRLTAELVGTFWLVFGGCGSAVLAAAFPGLGIGFLGVALAFGLTVLTGVYAVGHISGAHFNPAVTVGLAAGRRFPWSEVGPYVVAQVIGAIIASTVLYVIASGKAGFTLDAGFAANGYGAHSPGGYSMLAGLVAEVVLTAMFLVVILGATDRRAPAGFAGIAIGLALTLIHLIGIPVTKPVRQPGAQHRTRDLRRRLGPRSASGSSVRARVAGGADVDSPGDAQPARCGSRSSTCRDLAAVRAFAARFAPARVDVLIHNAGVLPATREETAEGLELTLATNVIGPFLLTHLLQPKLAGRRRRAGHLRFVWRACTCSACRWTICSGRSGASTASPPMRRPSGWRSF